MIAAVADTHAALWYLFRDVRLSVAAKEMIHRAADERLKIAIASISLVEVVYLVEKRRMASSAYQELLAAIEHQEHVFTEVPLTSIIVESMRHVSREAVPDMPDRIVAATGLHLGVPVISRDRRIRTASLQTIW